MTNPEEQREPLPPRPPFTHYRSPNTRYKFSQKVEETPQGREWLKGLESGWMAVDPTLEDSGRLNGLIMSGVAPRPIAFVSSLSSSGVANLAPFSWFNQVSAKPPVIVLSCAHAGGKPRDTAENIKATRQFTVNIISEPWIEQANTCSIDCPPDVSEWSLSNLTKESSTLVKPARVMESAFSMECELLHAIPIHHSGSDTVASTVFLAKVVMIHIRKDMLNERGVCDPGKLMAVCRLGGISFSRVTEGYELPRYPWSEVKHEFQTNDRMVNGDKQSHL